MEINKAKFIKDTFVAGRKKQRWECPNCRIKKEPECRFNLVPSKENKKHKCRFCNNELLLKKWKFKVIGTTKESIIEFMENNGIDIPEDNE